MEHLEEMLLRIAEKSPRLQKWFVVDIFVKQNAEHKENFLQHINNIDQAIKFTVESRRLDGSNPFLDTLVTPEQNITPSISVYRRPFLIY